MQLKINHSMNYSLDISIHNKVLTIRLVSDDKVKLRKFQGKYTNVNIPYHITQQFQTILQFYEFLKNNQKFTVNPIRGTLNIANRKEEKCQIKLQSIDYIQDDGDSQGQESVVSENFDQEIQNFVFPSFEEVKSVEKAGDIYIPTQYTDNFTRRNNKIKYTGEWYWTQCMIDTVMDRQVFNFRVKIAKTVDKNVMIGIVDRNKRMHERSSYDSGNAVSYYGNNGNIYYGGGRKFKQQGNGYCSGDVVRVQVELQKGRIRWYVNRKLKAQIALPILKQESRQFVPYFELCDSGDKVQYIC